MISERAFADSYPSFWKELLPGGSRFIKFLNRGAGRKVANEVPARSRTEIRSVIAETAFNLCKTAFSRLDLTSLSDDELLESRMWDESLAASQAFISKFADRPKDSSLSVEEAHECVVLSRSMWQHIKSESCDRVVEFEPKFAGWGLLNPSKGDVLIGDCLMEIKALEGAFGISHIRQILIYGTVNYLVKTFPSMATFELYNPRLGVSYTSSFDELAEGVAGCSSEELFLEISNGITDKITSL